MHKKIVFIKAPDKVVMSIKRKLFKMFGKDNVEKILDDKIIIMTIGGPRQELFLASKHMTDFLYNVIKEILNKEPYALGLFLGTFSKRKYKPSLDICEKLYKISKINAIMINEHATILFTYGRDVMAGSVIRIYPPLSEVVVVVDPEENVVGLCRVLSNHLVWKRLKENTIICKNIFDKGWYLRGGH